MVKAQQHAASSNHRIPGEAKVMLAILQTNNAIRLAVHRQEVGKAQQHAASSNNGISGEAKVMLAILQTNNAIRLAVYRQEVGKAQHQEAAATSQLEHVNKALQEVRGRVEQRRADSQAQTSQGAVVKALLAAKASKEIPGILGRLGTPTQSSLTFPTAAHLLTSSQW